MDGWLIISVLGVDACNTGLGVLIFASVMNLGQGWMTFITLFGCKPLVRYIPIK